MNEFLLELSRCDDDRSMCALMIDYYDRGMSFGDYIDMISNHPVLKEYLFCIAPGLLESSYRKGRTDTEFILKFMHGRAHRYRNSGVYNVVATHSCDRLEVISSYNRASAKCKREFLVAAYGVSHERLQTIVGMLMTSSHRISFLSGYLGNSDYDPAIGRALFKALMHQPDGENAIKRLIDREAVHPRASLRKHLYQRLVALFYPDV